MRPQRLMALCGLAAALIGPAAAADSPDALLSPLVPAPKTARVRLPVAGLNEGNGTLRVELPHGKNKGEVVTATVALDSGRGRSYVTAEALVRWGYEAKKDSKTVTLNDLWVLDGAQIAPAPKGGRDAAVRLPAVTLTVARGTGPNGAFGRDLSLADSALFPAPTLAGRAPRLAFADGFLEMTVPDARVRRPGTSAVPVPEVTADGVPGLVPVVAPMMPHDERFAYAAVNGVARYSAPGSPMRPVPVYVSSPVNWDTGVIISAGLAHKCQVKYDTKDRETGAILARENTVVLGTVTELRLGCYTDAALKKPVDLVLKNVPVRVDLGDPAVSASLGPKFFAAHVKDAVYAAGADGLWKLYGRCDKNALLNIASRP